MTPTLTNAQKYSPFYGFDPGVVVEMDTTYGGKTCCYFQHAEETKLWINDYEGIDDPSFIFFDDIKSIRLLSGPWAVWECAPKKLPVVGVEIEDASYCPIMFFKDLESFEALKNNPEQGYMYLPAPWWWLEGQK